MDVLVLNPDNSIISCCSVKRALKMLSRDMAELVRSVADNPAIIRLRKFVSPVWRGVPPKFSKSGVLYRDRYRCAYCKKKAETIDHVVPRARGGTNSWENCVAACFPCNNRKADMSVTQAGLVLRSKPRIPTHSELIKGKTVMDQDYVNFGEYDGYEYDYDSPSNELPNINDYDDFDDDDYAYTDPTYADCYA